VAALWALLIISLKINKLYYTHNTDIGHVCDRPSKTLFRCKPHRIWTPASRKKIINTILQRKKIRFYCFFIGTVLQRNQWRFEKSVAFIPYQHREKKSLIPYYREKKYDFTVFFLGTVLQRNQWRFEKSVAFIPYHTTEKKNTILLFFYRHLRSQWRFEKSVPFITTVQCRL
jgi:hypothetical protein